ncbi:hypothetical protein [Stygiolobus caldivivus]|uniref:Uncharacterized protein n=1 Tax=Stygiolobus caldivivus TaxID=2824673 RepID=A0A8D5U9C2_9CREN|nr:hypothetical protein [Stygiolobus caldivivus]BCU71273.1 hypothetical protein KN1_25700 [Stygiolobus caldivivus]
MNRDPSGYAKEIAKLSVTYDALHAALVSQNGVKVVITEDANDWSKIGEVWPKVKEKLDVKDNSSSFSYEG